MRSGASVARHERQPGVFRFSPSFTSKVKSRQVETSRGRDARQDKTGTRHKRKRREKDEKTRRTSSLGADRSVPEELFPQVKKESLAFLGDARGRPRGASAKLLWTMFGPCFVRTPLSRGCSTPAREGARNSTDNYAGETRITTRTWILSQNREFPEDCHGDLPTTKV